MISSSLYNVWHPSNVTETQKTTTIAQQATIKEASTISQQEVGPSTLGASLYSVAHEDRNAVLL